MILCICIYWIFYNYIWNLLSSPQEKSIWFKVKKIYVDSLDLIPSPSPSVKIQIIGGKVFCFQKFVDNAQQCFAFTPQADCNCDCFMAFFRKIRISYCKFLMPNPGGVRGADKDIHNYILRVVRILMKQTLWAFNTAN